MKIKDGFIVRNVAGSYIVVATMEKTVDFNGIMTLNETGYFLWQRLSEGCDKDALLEAMLKEYDVASELASADIDRFIKQLEDASLVE